MIFLFQHYIKPGLSVMQKGRKFVERRKHKRFKVKDLAFAKLWSKHEEDYVQDMGQLLDISRKGLALRYSVKTEKTDEHYGLGIFLSGNIFSVDKIPFKIVSDVEMESDSTFSNRAVRRFGIQFGELTPRQVDKLDYFFLNHTLGET